MAKSRLEKLTEEEAESQAERDRFEELADQYRQQSHLPPEGDQSWREREAVRRAAYDKGYAPPQGDPSPREHEAMRFAPVREEEAADAATDQNFGMQEPVWQPPPVRKGGQGGTILIFVLVAAIAFGITVLAYPEMLTAAYWRTPGTQPNSVPQNPPRAAEPPAAPATLPAAPPAEQPAPSPDLSAAPAPPAPPSSLPVPDANAVPAPPAQEAPPPPVSVIDATPSAKPVPAPKPKPSPRASTRDDRGAGGFYAKVPGPNGTMEYQYFPAHPDSDASVPARKEPAVPDTGGFYAKAPGPDGRLQYRYFPRQPPPR